MIGNKKIKSYSEYELKQLMAVREMWRNAQIGNKVCVVSKYLVDWDTILGQYKEVVHPWVESGMIYLRLENCDEGDHQLTVEDLDNVIVEWDR